MKKILKTTILLCFLIASSPGRLLAQQKNGYEITGHLNGLKDGTKIINHMMVYLPDGAQRVPADSSYIKNGEFHLSGIVPEGPRIYWLKIDAPKQQWFRMFIDNGQSIMLRCEQDVQKIPHTMLDDYITCEGSPSYFSYKLVERYGDAFDAGLSSFNHVIKEMKDSIGFDSVAVKYLLKARRILKDQIYFRHFDPVHADLLQATTYFAMYEQDDHSAYWADIYSQLDDHQKASVLGKKLKQRLPLLEGEKMPPFSLPDQTGKTVSLDELVKSGKITLVRFWATNSFQRKQFDAELRAMYKLYHNKGLNIVAISTESFEEQWKETLAKENYPWLNLFDKRGEKVVDPIYHEFGTVDHQNTTNVLLDKNGRIIAWDPMGSELQYYIMNALGN